ncbi:uncharacterized protein LOC110683117 [Chenopodium quinoa]|uniref:uncharacterized protein LOC110683117 n=1 Tax=Chenopodium quinoa TaxID=63459 RepID=UPI000B782E2B|nr:uncharacterized protein LOC110683117 [Chenopodium quinoa]
MEDAMKSLLEYGIPNTTTGLLSNIVRPPVTAQHFELKPQFIQFISNDSFAGTPHDCPDKLVKAFLVKFLGHEKTARLRNELSTFRQSDDESLYEAWRRFKRLQRQCPHHGILEWLLIQTFYNGLTHEFRIYIDAASGGSLLTKNPTEAKELIEKMAANDNYHLGGRQNVKKGGKLDVDALTMLASSVQALTSRFDKFQAGTSTSPPEVCQLCNVQGHIAPDFPQNMSEMSIEQANAFYSSNSKQSFDPYSNSYNEGWKQHPNFSYKNTQGQQNPPSQPSLSNNYNSPPGFQQRTPMNQQPTQLLPQKSSLELMMESFITTTNSAIQQQGSSIQQLQAQIFLRRDEPSPRQIGEKVCSVESRKDERGKDVQGPKYVAPPAYEEPLPFPQRLSKAVLDRHFGKYCEALEKVHASTPFSDLLIQMPQFANFVKTMKDQQNDKEVVNKKGPTLLYDNLPPKLHDPGSFIIPCTINEKFFDRVLCDLGAGGNLMPYSLYESLGLQGLKPSPISLQLADRTSRLPKGVVEDVLVTVGELVFPVDFVVMDMKEDRKIPIIFGRPFLATSQALIDFPEGQATIRAQDKQVMFKLFDEHNSIFDGGTCLRIDATNPLFDKYVFDRNFVRRKDKIPPDDVLGHIKVSSDKRQAIIPMGNIAEFPFRVVIPVEPMSITTVKLKTL